MPSVNDIISVADYNDIQAKVAKILGPSESSDSDRGYGQFVRSSPVDESTRITVNEWGDLRYDITNCYRHLHGTAPPSSITGIVPVDGETVTYEATTEPVGYWVGVAATLDADRLLIAPVSQRVMTNHTPTLKAYSSPWGTATTNEALACNVTMSFSSATHARQWFNSGSYIEFQSYFTKSEDKAQTRAWESLLSTAGPQIFGGNFPGTGKEPNDGQNYFRLNAAFGTPAFNIAASSPYSSNTWKIFANSPGVTDNSDGTATTVGFYIEWRDAYVDPPVIPDPNTGAIVDPAPADGVTGTMELSVKTYQAFGAMEPPGTPNFELEQPTVTVGEIFGTA